MFWKQVSFQIYNLRIYSPFFWVVFSLCGRDPLKQKLHTYRRKRNHQQNEEKCVEWERILENHIFDKRSISKTHEEFIKLNSKNRFKNE